MLSNDESLVLVDVVERYQMSFQPKIVTSVYVFEHQVYGNGVENSSATLYVDETTKRVLRVGGGVIRKTTEFTRPVDGANHARAIDLAIQKGRQVHTGPRQNYLVDGGRYFFDETFKPAFFYRVLQPTPPLTQEQADQINRSGAVKNRVHEGYIGYEPIFVRVESGETKKNSNALDTKTKFASATRKPRIRKPLCRAKRPRQQL